MTLELRDELAARIAASLSSSTMSPREIAVRAYAIADRLLVARAEPTRADLELAELEDDRALWADPGPPHDPRWELEPRWSLADRARRDRAVRGYDEDGPGLAATRPSWERDDAAKTG